MVCFRFASFLSGFLLLVMKALGDCTSTHHPGHYTVEDEVDVRGRGTRVLQAQMEQENIDGGRAGYMRKLIMFGGKDMLESRSPKPDIIPFPGESGMHKVSSKKIAGAVLKAKPLVPTSSATATPRSSPHVTDTRAEHGKHSKTASVLSGKGSSNFESTSRTDPPGKQETKQMSWRLYSSEKNEGGEEIVRLMYRDYRGVGGPKPPVHNNQPWP